MQESETGSVPCVKAAVQHLKSVFVEEPEKAFTLAEACRITGLEQTICLPILNALADVRFVRRRRDGTFIRLDSGKS